MREIIFVIIVTLGIIWCASLCTKNYPKKRLETYALPSARFDEVKHLKEYAKKPLQTPLDGVSRGGGYNLPSNAGNHQKTAPARPEIVRIDNGTPPALNAIEVVPDAAINSNVEGNGEFAMPL